MHHEPDFFKIENHEYVTHHTYSGPDCAVCGKSEAGHMPPKLKRTAP